MLRKSLYLLLVIFIGLTIIYWDLLAYGIGQAKGQIRVIQQARDIEEVLVDPDFPDSLKQKIHIIQEVRKFAIDSIGLIDSENYTTIFDQKGKTILWNLSACEPYSFTPKTWLFPLLGSFPYKGFFDLEKAKKERDALKLENYDTRIRTVGGWSTLGWFSDPILSNMLTRSEGKLADLIFHELTHSTLFVKDDIVFNENLASFIGKRAAVQFLKSKYGKGSFELEEYLIEEEDTKNFINQMLISAQLLDSLYQTFTESVIETEREKQKSALIKSIVNAVDTIHFHNNRYYQIFETASPNNAYFMSFLRYHSAEDSLATLLESKYDGDLNLFVKGMVEYHND